MRKLALLIGILVMFSAIASADSLTDPTGILRSGDLENYPSVGVVEGTTFTFNPFNASFCQHFSGLVIGESTFSGQDCQLENGNGFSFTSLMVDTSPSNLILHCINLLSPADGCLTSNHSLVYLFGHNPIIGSEDWVSSGSGFEYLFASDGSGGFPDQNYTLRFNVPEPASGFLLLPGVTALAGLLKRKKLL